jgi:demethylspheroidene O-methyltransferase
VQQFFDVPNKRSISHPGSSHPGTSHPSSSGPLSAPVRNTVSTAVTPPPTPLPPITGWPSLSGWPTLAGWPSIAGLSDRAYAARDQLVASPVFQRWAAAFPLTRPTAKKNARALFDLCAGFVYSQILLACVRVRLLDILAEGPMELRDLAVRTGLSVSAVSRLVRAAASLGLVAERRGGRIGLAMKGAALRGNPGALAMIEHHALLYADLVDPVALLRGQNRETQLSQYWPYASASAAAALGSGDITAYTSLMSVSQTLIAEDIISAYPFTRHKKLLDVGGGDGSFLAAVGKHAPHLQRQLFDLPAVAAQAEARFSADAMSSVETGAEVGRVEVIGGDFTTDELPDGADVVSLVRIILDHNDDGALKILSAIRRILPPDGVLMIAEPMRELAGVEPVSDAYFGFYLLAMGRGETRSPAQFTKLLEAAGFDRIKTVATRRPILTGMIVARPAQSNRVNTA